MFRIQRNTEFHNIYSPEELGRAIEDTIKYYKERADWLQAMCNELREHAQEYVDENLRQENKHLRSRLSLSYGEFASEKEKQAYLDFEKAHTHDRLSSKYNGGRAPYLIPTGTGFGTNLKVKCPICGEEKDITDTEVW